MRSSTAASSRSAGTALLIRPQSAAVAASIGSPVIAISSARLRPTLRPTATSGVWQNSPPLPPGIAKPAVSAAMARSHVATNWHPAAVARACTLAMTGCGIDWIASIITVHTSKSRRVEASDTPAMSAKLWPAENTGPLAARITPSASDSPICPNASIISSITPRASALRLSGRFRVTVTIGPLCATRMCSKVITPVSHLQRRPAQDHAGAPYLPSLV